MASMISIYPPACFQDPLSHYAVGKDCVFFPSLPVTYEMMIIADFLYFVYYFKNLGNLFFKIRVTTRNWIDNFPEGEMEPRKLHPAMAKKRRAGER